MWGYPGKKLLFMGCEFGQWQEWNHDTGLEWQALDAPRHQGMQRLARDLNLVYQHEPALHQVDFDWSGFKWIDANDSDNSVLSFIRYAKNPEDFVIVICNFTPVVREQYRIGVPKAGAYRELINSDQEIYGGSGISNGPVINTLAGTLPHLRQYPVSRFTSPFHAVSSTLFMTLRRLFFIHDFNQTTYTMKIRLILLSLVGVAAYIVLANFNSKMIKETTVSKDHGKVSAPASPSRQGCAAGCSASRRQQLPYQWSRLHL